MENIRKRIVDRLDKNIEAIESGDISTEEQLQSIADEFKQARNDFKKLGTWVQFAQRIADIGFWEHNYTNDTIYWSEETYQIWGYSPQEVNPTPQLFKERIHPKDQEQILQKFRESQENNEEYNVVFRLQFPDGQIKFIESHAVHFYDDAGNILFTLGTNQNVTERELQKQEIEQSLQENRTMLDEIHHRVKNNLAVVAGMLQLQWLQEDDPEIAGKLQDSANRIKTVAGIHQQLYESDHLADVSLGENIERLAKNLIQSMETDTKIGLHTTYDEVHLDIKQTLPCSLIANEVVTNAIKYAFEGQDEGEIAIELNESKDTITLKISDNGVGLPEGYEEKESSLGMNLIKTLSAQLEADYNFESSAKGTHFTITFRNDRK